MNYFAYNIYNMGRVGLSNAILSLELGVGLAYLMDRILLLGGNISPPANLVSYAGQVSQAHPSRVTDLLEVPVPWLDYTDRRESPKGVEMTEHSLLDSVFYFPSALDTETVDFDHFRQRRSHRFTYTEDQEHIKVLALSGGTPIGEMGVRLNNLGIYSTFFYVEPQTLTNLKRVMAGIRPKKCFTEFANSVCRSLDKFNAVHIRLGDFKKSAAKSIGRRKPADAIERLDRNFGRDDLLLILTDDSRDPFLNDILRTYRHHIILDEFILKERGHEFRDLPFHDSIALAFICQLIAAHASEFVGAMTSTYTSIIQRLRGSMGLDERFKFLWSELPLDPRTNPNESRSPESIVPLHPNGEMICLSDGPYSWNRYSPLVHNGWMREWPESFLPCSGSFGNS
jgi:hypothetical protein